MNAKGMGCRVFAWALLPLVMSACTLTPQAPDVPTGAEIKAYVQQDQGPSYKNADPADIKQFVAAGYDLTDQQCDRFFTAVYNLRNNLSFTKDTLVSAASAASVFAGIAGVSAKVLTALAGGTGLIPTSINNYQQVYLMASVPNETRNLVFDGMAAWRAKYPPGSITSATDARSVVRGYANYCTLPSITQFVSDSVKSSKTVLEKPPEAKPGTDTPPPPTTSTTPPPLGAGPRSRPVPTAGSGACGVNTGGAVVLCTPSIQAR